MATVTANRRRQIFRAVRGSKLSSLRGRSSGEQNVPLATGPRADFAYGDEQRSKRRVRLDPRVEDEMTEPDLREPPRYSEPND